MVPSGKITEDTFQKLLDILEPGDTIVDGGNSNFRDSQRRYKEARKQQDLVRRRRRLRRDLGPRGRLLPDGRRRQGAGEAAAADLRGAGAGERLGARRRLRRGPLHEDGPQRDRVRADAGVRRGLRADAPLRVRARPERDRRHLALRLGRPLVAARAAARGDRAARRQARRHRPLRRGLRRGPLDDQRGDQRERAGAGDQRRALRPLRLAARDRLLGEGRGRAAEPVRRARGQGRQGREEPDPTRGELARRREPAARGPAAAPQRRPVRDRRLRRVRRPDAAEALPGALLARAPPAAARAVRRSSASRAPSRRRSSGSPR